MMEIVRRVGFKLLQKISINLAHKSCKTFAKYIKKTATVRTTLKL